MPGNSMLEYNQSDHLEPLFSETPMCIFSQAIENVYSTMIFARATAAKTQFLAYQMSYKSERENAMILPLPIRQPTHAASLRFIDLKHYEDFFDHLATGFPKNVSGLGCSAIPNVPKAIEVQRVGNYVASFVPTLADFARLDPRFTLPHETWAKIPAYKDYGFAVFQLAEGSLTPHPMAFEFETSRNDIFFPTLHIHDGELHEREEFDHVLYLQHAGFDSRVGNYFDTDFPDSVTGWIRSRMVASQFCKIANTRELVKGELLVHRRIIRGEQPNQDTLVNTWGDAETPTFNYRSWLQYSPWLLVAAAGAWFLRRRDRIRQKTKDLES